MYITSYSPLIRDPSICSVIAVRRRRQRLGRCAAEYLDEHIDQQQVRLAAGIDHPGGRQHVELLRRTGEARRAASWAACTTARCIAGPAGRCGRCRSGGPSATVRIVPATGRATARRAATAADCSRSGQSPCGIARKRLQVVLQARQTLTNISAMMAPEFPCAQRIAA